MSLKGIFFGGSHEPYLDFVLLTRTELATLRDKVNYLLMFVQKTKELNLPDSYKKLPDFYKDTYFKGAKNLLRQIHFITQRKGNLTGHVTNGKGGLGELPGALEEIADFVASRYEINFSMKGNKEVLLYSSERTAKDSVSDIRSVYFENIFKFTMRNIIQDEKVVNFLYYTVHSIFFSGARQENLKNALQCVDDIIAREKSFEKTKEKLVADAIQLGISTGELGQVPEFEEKPSNRLAQIRAAAKKLWWRIAKPDLFALTRVNYRLKRNNDALESQLQNELIHSREKLTLIRERQFEEKRGEALSQTDKIQTAFILAQETLQELGFLDRLPFPKAIKKLIHFAQEIDPSLESIAPSILKKEAFARLSEDPKEPRAFQDILSQNGRTQQITEKSPSSTFQKFDVKF